MAEIQVYTSQYTRKKLEEILDDLQTTVTNLKKTVEVLDGGENGKDGLSDIIKRLENLEKGGSVDLDELQKTIDALQGKVNKLQGDLNEGLGTLQSTVNDVGELKTKLDDLGTLQGKFDALDTKVDELNTTVSQNSTNITNLKNDVSSLNTEISYVSREISGIKLDFKSTSTVDDDGHFYLDAGYKYNYIIINSETEIGTAWDKTSLNHNKCVKLEMVGLNNSLSNGQELYLFIENNLPTSQNLYISNGDPWPAYQGQYIIITPNKKRLNSLEFFNNIIPANDVLEISIMKLNVGNEKYIIRMG